MLNVVPWWLSGKESTCQCRRHRFDPWVRKIPWRRKRQPTPVFLPGEPHGQRSLASCTPWGSQKSRIWLGMHTCTLLLDTHFGQALGYSSCPLHTMHSKQENKGFRARWKASGQEQLWCSLISQGSWFLQACGYFLLSQFCDALMNCPLHSQFSSSL